ncbi:MAG: DUF192 domain-containing protein [Thermoanaerobaculia bacterium]|jgi:hypothetical protein
MRHAAVSALLVATLSAATACESPATTADTPVSRPAASAPTVVSPDGSTIVIEVVADPDTRAQGLMFRSSIGAGHGMLFIFPASDVHSFWMKNTLIPLDILWIDEARTVVHVERNVPPCKADPCPSYPPKAAAKFVLELGAGQAAAHRLDVGGKLVFSGIENIVAR